MKFFHKILVPFLKRYQHTVIIGGMVIVCALIAFGQWHQREKMDALDASAIPMGITK